MNILGFEIDPVVLFGALTMASLAVTVTMFLMRNVAATDAMVKVGDVQESLKNYASKKEVEDLNNQIKSLRSLAVSTKREVITLPDQCLGVINDATKTFDQKLQTLQSEQRALDKKVAVEIASSEKKIKLIVGLPDEAPKPKPVAKPKGKGRAALIRRTR